MLASSPLLETSVPPHGEAFPEHPVPLVGKQSLGETTSALSIVGCFVEAPTLILPNRNCKRICRAQPVGICDKKREEIALSSTSLRILGDLYLYRVLFKGLHSVNIPDSNQFT